VLNRALAMAEAVGATALIPPDSVRPRG